ncbi:DUF4400 domain-containing protein [Proteus terrae]|uniref:DUF4400 domain-containing protein n=1 Tax=Proteus terrae TaxID=1574161 RepID=UPI003B0061BF
MFIYFIVSSCLIIFKFGDKYFLGELFIGSSNKDITRYSCLFFALYLCISLPFAVYPNLLLLPSILLIGKAIRVKVGSFKKYF